MPSLATSYPDLEIHHVRNPTSDLPVQGFNVKPDNVSLIIPHAIASQTSPKPDISYGPSQVWLKTRWIH